MSAGAVPRVSVVMPVHNGAEYVRAAVESVFAQTIVDLELLAIDDGSTDRTGEILAAIPDPRLRVIRFPAQRGLVAALNLGFAESRSAFIARMDADDVCLAQRFARQLAFMEAHPDVAICGTWTRLFGRRSGVHRVATDPAGIHARLFFGGAIDHPSALLRRAFIEAHGLEYDEAFRHAEDFDFFIRAAGLGRLANLPEVLLLHRLHAGQVSVRHRDEQLAAHARLLARQLRELVPADAAEEDFHVRLAMGRLAGGEFERAERWLLRLERANSTKGRYDRTAFSREIRQCWFRAHRAAATGVRTLCSYWRSSLGTFRDIGVGRHIVLASKAMLGGSGVAGFGTVE